MINTLILYSIFNILLFYTITKLSYKLNFLDLPDERKIHSKATAYTGGIIISISLLASLEIFKLFNYINPNLNLIFSIAFLISLVGLTDDKFNLNAGGKLSLQIIPIFYLVVLENISLQSIGNYEYFSLDLGAFVLPFSILSVLFLTNAFNYFDGLDGTLSFLSISVLIILLLLVQDKNIKLFLIILIIPIAIFLFFNFSILKLPKLFLGDSGSLLIGFIISFILIFLAKENLVHPILLAWSIAIFVYEFLSINIIRLKDNQSLFKASRDHLHHILLKKNYSIFKTNLFIITINSLLFLSGYFVFEIINSLASLILFIFLFIVFLFLRNKYSTSV